MRDGDDLTGRERDSLLRDVATLLPVLRSMELKDRWATGSPASQALRDIEIILGVPDPGPLWKEARDG